MLTEAPSGAAGHSTLPSHQAIASWTRGGSASTQAEAHPYLAEKGVVSHGLRVAEDSRLLVPVQDADGKLWSLQRVGRDGFKQASGLMTGTAERSSRASFCSTPPTGRARLKPFDPGERRLISAMAISSGYFPAHIGDLRCLACTGSRSSSIRS